MSHTTTYKDIEIKSVQLLQQAVEFLKNEQVVGKKINCTLEQNAKPRMYYQNQLYKHKRKETVDFVLRLHDCNYDIGFDWDEQTQTYELYYDNWNDYIRKEIGYYGEELKQILEARKKQSELSGRENTLPTDIQMDLGRFLKCYSLAVAKDAIDQSGYSIEETSLGQNELEQQESKVCMYLNAAL